MICALACGGADRPDKVTFPTGPTEPRGVDPGSRSEKSLYDRMGGIDAIRLVVDDFVANMAADPRLSGFFLETDIGTLKRQLVNQICSATGGGCPYSGRGISEVHAGMAITNAQFNAMIEDLRKSLDRHEVPAREQTELLRLLSAPSPADRRSFAPPRRGRSRSRGS
jgi:hemoglobin